MNVLARRDPTVKLAVVFAISLLLILIVDPVTPSLFLVVAIGVALAGGTRPATILRALVPLSILGVGFVWSNALFAATQGPATWTIGPVHASESGLRFGLAIAMDARAFAAATRRTYYRETRLTWDDALFVLAAAVTTTALLVLSAWLGSLRTVLG